MTREDPVKHFFLWPAVLVVLAIAIFPLIFSLANSFMSLRLVPPRPSKFVGFENYIDLLGNERFWQVVKTTSLISFTSVAFQFVIGFAIALALVKKVRGADFFRVSFLLPMLVAPVAVALVAKQILNPSMGPLNQVTTFFGFPNLPFLTDATWALGSLIAVEIWQWTPFVILLLLAGLQGLPDDVYEAAELENASPWRQFWGITFPMMLPISVAVIFIRIVESFKIIDTVFVMTGGGPGIST
ncbi:MAG: sugar ABC transporter permease, partial [Hyphomicrobiales bacterium]